jgi:hypothetical protein
MHYAMVLTGMERKGDEREVGGGGKEEGGGNREEEGRGRSWKEEKGKTHFWQ